MLALNRSKSYISENKIFLFHPSFGSSICVPCLIAISQALKKQNNLLFNPPIRNLVFKINLFILIVLPEPILNIPLAFFFNQLITANQIYIFSLIPILAAIVHINLDNLKINPKILYLLIFIVFFATIKFHFRFNIDRKFHDLEHVDKDKAIKASVINSNFKNLRWISKLDDPKNELEVIKQAIEKLFKVKVKSINTTKVKGKTKVFKGTKGRRADYKKAIVYHKEGENLDYSGGVN